MPVATAANRLAKCLILFGGDPANREFNREFCEKSAFGAPEPPNSRVVAAR